ncbi:MAG TPA: PEP-CTERM sorting domain-containing protein [Pyrinomonadaceae bacterium]|nr:PEP-CTERM sorting domain-containing protein [Pyrinomonadaceae bacterium]
MRNRAFRPIAAILSILLFAGTRVYAGPVAINEVIQMLADYQSPAELRLRTVSHTNSQIGSIRSTGHDSTARLESASFHFGDNPARDGSVVNSLFSGIGTGTDKTSAGVDVVASGDLEGTICDCGEITVPGGDFPKWPLLFLAAVPFFFIHDCDDCDSPTPTLTPTPPREMPEPTSLLLLGSGLAAFGAGLRRRYGRAKVTTGNTEEG